MYDVHKKAKDLKTLIAEFVKAIEEEDLDAVMVIGMKSGQSVRYIRSANYSESVYEWLGIIEQAKSLVIESMHE